MTKTLGLLSLIMLAGCDLVGASSGAGLRPGEQVELVPGAYEVMRAENEKIDGQQRKPRNVRHDKVTITAAQADSFPGTPSASETNFLSMTLDRLAVGLTDCRVGDIQMEGNSFKATGTCEGKQDDRGSTLQAQFAGLRGEDAFEYTVEGFQTYKEGGADHRLEFNNRYTGKLVPESQES